jgi:multiple sugar transport system ATP-binding protein
VRVAMRSELVELQRQLGITTIYVTHDQTEAMTMSDRIALMMGGQIVQTGSPTDIFHDPAHISVASFVGTPRINLLPATVADGRVHCLGIDLPVAVPGAPAGTCQLGFRPEDLSLSTDPADAGDGSWQAEIVRAEEIGHECLVHLRTHGPAPVNLIVRQSAESRSESGLPSAGPVAVIPDLRRAKLFDGAGNRIAPLISTVEPAARAASRAGGRF